MTSVSGQAADVRVMSMTACRLGVDGDAVDEAEVDDVDAELGVDDVAQGLLDVATLAGLVVSVMAVAPSLGRRSGRGDVDAGSGEGVGEGGPAQQRALDAGGVLRDAGEGHPVAEDVLVAGGPGPWRSTSRAWTVVCLERLAHGWPMTSSASTEARRDGDRAALRA